MRLIEGYRVRGLVRTEEQAERVATLGITPVLGTRCIRSDRIAR
ncbi:hypothetical protein CAter282_3668 [Collimonas arenae]|uniref:Uncharacterized protein n=1 Tax=Collimonas arenae TaxID=279058 RepID=A0A127PUF5_9BURK|nr:hypothetical protein CAter10_4013 [Collimonas arenae]AMP11351.1 hypothetical protein CAter282_3668 [Collimonas arenae]